MVDKNLKNMVESYQDDIDKLLRLAFKDPLIYLFEKYEKLGIVDFNIYTPSFNDGEPCEKTVTSFVFLLTDENGKEFEFITDDNSVIKLKFKVDEYDDEIEKYNLLQQDECDGFEFAVDGSYYREHNKKLLSKEDFSDFEFVSKKLRSQEMAFDSDSSVSVLYDRSNKELKYIIGDYDCGY